MLRASDRLDNVAPYALAKVFAARDAKLAEGVDVIDLGVGNPDMRPAPHIVAALEAALEDTKRPNHRYPSFTGLPEFRRSIAAWYERRFGVTLDPDTEVLPLIGSKEGIAKFFFAHLNPGDPILLTTPCYPAYVGIAALTQALVHDVPLTMENGYRPDLAAIPDVVADRSHLITINFPGNPTGGTETPETYERLLAWAEKHDVFVISDIAYCDLPLDADYRAHSFLEFDRAKKRSVEYHSFSKSYSMQGWRIGFVTGNAEAIGRLAKIKANMDFGVFTAIPRAAMVALDGPQDYCAEVAALYRGRRDVFLAGVRALGFELPTPKAGMYVWLPIPRGAANSIDFTADLLERTGVVVSPGSGFGKSGEGYVRVALCDSEARIADAVKRIAEAGIRAEGLPTAR
ncbi:MAG: aminotransferase class I/II-fold pyridoxal phosphate-dependent enzyme [Candidatus Eisenbacteria bacterium]